MPADDREQNFERALARHLRSAADSSCPDAEILAAYHERMLSLDEMVFWKEHIAACSRCQESLALVEQTDRLPAEEWEHEHVLHPVEQTSASLRSLAATSSLPRSAPAAASASIHDAVPAQINKASAHLPWRWVAPLGLAAAAAIVWVGVQEIRTQHLSPLQERATQIAENRAPAAAPRISENREASTPPPATKAAPTDELSRDASSPKTKPQSPQPSPRVALTAPSAPSSPSATVNPPVQPVAKLPPAELTNNLAARSSSNSEVQVPPPAPVASYVEKEQDADQVAQLKLEREAAKKQRSENAPPSAAAETVQVQAPTVNKTAAAAQVTSYQSQLGDLLLLAAADRHYIVAPGQTQAWRLGNGGLVEHSTDRGKTWKPQTSGVTADLTSGSAPSDKVCWVVGKAGTVLLTTDGGKHWKSLTSPIAADLGGIHAADAMHASVWDVPNRNSFETTDGGATWTRTANE